MNRSTLPVLLVALAALALPGCGRQTDAVAPQPVTATPVATTPDDELALYCRVCVVEKGERIREYLPERLNVVRAGKTYRFCADGCQARFKAEPAKYAL